MAQDITIDTSAYADGAILTEAKLDTTFGNVETAIENVLNGAQAFDSILANATAETCNVSAGVVTVTRMYAEINGETATDDVDTITLTNGKFSFVRAASGDTITLKHGTGNITTDGASDVTLSGNETALVYAAGGQVGVIGYGAAGGGGIGGSTGATDNRLLRADGTGGSTVQSSAITVDDSGVMTGVSLDADGAGNVLTNIGAAEVKADLISGQTLITTVDGTNDRLLIWDATDSLLKEVAPDNLPGGGSGLYTSVAILRDEKSSGTAGGSCSATTWNNRNLNTEAYDPDGIVAISSNQFTPIAGDYEIDVVAGVFKGTLNRLRLYNVTGAASVEEGLNQSANSADSTTTVAHLFAKFTANGTDAYRIDHYTSAAQATTGLGAAVSDGSAEVYMEIILRKLS